MVDAPKHAAALRRLRVLFLDCGIRDQWFLHLGLRVLVRKLERLRVKVVHEEFDDDHMSISYRYDRSLPLLVKHLDKE
jgi:enterochelin esterase family protein